MGMLSTAACVRMTARRVRLVQPLTARLSDCHPAGVARFQPDATAIKFHFHSDEADTSKGFMATFEQIYDCD